MRNTQAYDLAAGRTRPKNLTGGLALILLGLVLLGRSLGWPVPENWWALFLLVPVAPKLALAGGLISRGNPAAAVRALGSSFVLLLIALVFLLNLDWDGVWPVLLIAAGVMMLIPRGRR